MFYVLLRTLHRKMRVSSVTDMQNVCRLATPPRGPGRRRWRPDSSIPAHDPLQHVALASYPRSGNTLLRSLLEQNVCTLTGSDMRVDSCALPLARRLRSFGLRAEGRCDASVWLIKTHFPERSGELFSPVRVFGAVVLVRNPCDAIDSLWNMRRTRSHTRSVWPLAYRFLRESFRATVRDEAAFSYEREVSELATTPEPSRFAGWSCGFDDAPESPSALPAGDTAATPTWPSSIIG